MSTVDQQQAARLAKGSFAAWKLDVIHAIASDSRLQASDARVATVMMHFISADDLSLYPSQELLGDLATMKQRNLRDCLERLRIAGWIQWDRGNRQRPNLYRFEAQTVADQLARVKREEQEHRAARKGRRKPVSDRHHSAAQNAVSDRHHSAAPDRHHSAAEHLKGTAHTLTTEKIGIEEVA